MADFIQPDRVLLDLGRQYDGALAAEDAALARWTAACDAYDAAQPVPEALHCQAADFETSARCARPGRRGDFYAEEEVSMLRAKPRTRPLYEIVEKATGARVEVASPREFSESSTHELQGRSVPEGPGPRRRGRGSLGPPPGGL